MARKTKEDTQKTVAAILDAAEEVFVEQGVSKATIAQIAERAGVSKGAVYGHYTDKIDVGVAVCRRGLAALKSIPEGSVRASPVETLEVWGMKYLRGFLESRSLSRVGVILYVKCERSPEYEAIHRIRALLERLCFRLTLRQIKRAMAVEEYPANLDPYVANVYLHGVVDGIFGTFYWTDRVPEAEQVPYAERILKGALESIRLAESFRTHS